VCVCVRVCVCACVCVRVNMSESEIERKNDISDTRCTRHTIFYVCHIYMY